MADRDDKYRAMLAEGVTHEQAVAELARQEEGARNDAEGAANVAKYRAQQSADAASVAGRVANARESIAQLWSNYRPRQGVSLGDPEFDRRFNDQHSILHTFIGPNSVDNRAFAGLEVELSGDENEGARYPEHVKVAQSQHAARSASVARRTTMVPQQHHYGSENDRKMLAIRDRLTRQGVFDLNVAKVATPDSAALAAAAKRRLQQRAEVVELPDDANPTGAR